MDKFLGIFEHSPFGAQLLRAQWHGQYPWLYCTPYSPQPGQAIRGGVPVLFPQFANFGQLRKHGFARNLQWQHINSWENAHEYGAVYEISLNESNVTSWPHSASLNIKLVLQSDALLIELHVKNTSKSSISWTGGLHPYWWVPKLQDASIKGLDGESSDELTFSSATLERLYPNNGCLMLNRREAGILKLQATGFTDWMVWTPGDKNIHFLKDMPAEDYQQFLCIEPLCASKAIELKVGESFIGTLKAQLIK
jgi:glucose-6-phosphate 1-epimerase